MLCIGSRRSPHHSIQLRCLNAWDLERETMPTTASVNDLAQATAVRQNQRTVGKRRRFRERGMLTENLGIEAPFPWTAIGIVGGFHEKVECAHPILGIDTQ